jgi:hypothetical protein
MFNNRNDPAVPSGENSQVPAHHAYAFKLGPRNGMVLSTISVALLFAGWLVFNRLFFSIQGPVGLAEREREILPSKSMNFSMRGREDLLKLVYADEESLEKARITEWFAQEFFATEFRLYP